MRACFWLSMTLAVLAAGRALAANGAGAPQDMIRDGGFENGDKAGIGTSWVSESWGSNTPRFDLATDRVQSGKNCQHIHVDEYKDGAAQICQFGMHLSKGQPYAITVWLRGSLSAPVTVGFRRHEAPYTFYLKQDVKVRPAWQRFTIAGTASDSDDNAGLYLAFGGNGDLWIDSVSAKAGTETAAAPASSPSP